MAEKKIENMLADDLRDAIKLGGKTVEGIAEATDIPAKTILRFMQGADLP